MDKLDLKNFPMNGLKPRTPLSAEEAARTATAEKEIVDTHSEKSVGEKSLHSPVNWLPFGVTSYAQLEQYESAQEAAFEIAEKSRLFPQMVENIMYDDEIDDKSAAIAHMSTEFGAFVKRQTDEVNNKKEISAPTDLDGNGLVVWKQDNLYRFLAVYSNNYRDAEFEIISSKSHERFVEKVDSGEFPMPVLQHFHIPGTEWGQAEMVHYDKETGFAIASGYILPGHEAEAEAMMAMDDVAMSHGMLKSSVQYDPADPSVLIEHQTIEISDLPVDKAANKLTNFHVISKETDNMLTEEKKDYLKKAGVVDVTGLEKSLASGKSLAESLQLDSKEDGGASDSVPPVESAPSEELPAEEVATPAEETPATSAEAPAEEVPTEEAPADEPATESKSAEKSAVEPAFSEAQTKELSDAFELLVGHIEKSIGAIIDERLAPIVDDAEKNKEATVAFTENFIAKTPMAGLQDAIINKGFLSDLSATKSPNTQLDGRVSLSKDAPAENKEEASLIISSGNPLIDQLATDLANGKVLEDLQKA